MWFLLAAPSLAPIDDAGTPREVREREDPRAVTIRPDRLDRIAADRADGHRPDVGRDLFEGRHLPARFGQPGDRFEPFAPIGTGGDRRQGVWRPLEKGTLGNLVHESCCS